MLNLTLKDCIEFQEIFWHEGFYSPYEKVKNINSFFPMTIIGEVGSLINSLCKQVRSPNLYSKEIKDECVDIFACILIYALIIQKQERLDLLNKIEKTWTLLPKIKMPKNLNTNIVNFINEISRLLGSDRKKFLTSDFFLRLFEMLRSVSVCITDKSWQENKLPRTKSPRFFGILSFAL